MLCYYFRLQMAPLSSLFIFAIRGGGYMVMFAESLQTYQMTYPSHDSHL